MSVVNRMLLDIDHRLAARGAEPNRVYPDIRSVPEAPRASRRGGLRIGLGIAAVLVLAGAWVALRDEADPVPAKAARAPVSVLAGLPAPAVPAAPVGAVPAPGEPAIELRSLKLAELLSDHAAPPEPAPAARVEPARHAAPVAPHPAPVPVAARSPVAMAAPAAAPLRQVAADETVAAARRLWADGARDAALATLRDALAAAEAERNASATAELARELARLEMTGNRAQAALDLLKRLEGALGEDADAWALRGNAEQRLALHHDAAASYLAALKLRPGEGRWMVGAAISLAADGRQAEAQAWVVRARARGAITPPIAAYLQQIGIDPR